MYNKFEVKSLMGGLGSSDLQHFCAMFGRVSRLEATKGARELQ